MLRAGPGHTSKFRALLSIPDIRRHTVDDRCGDNIENNSDMSGFEENLKGY